jgi:hypothetical protein
MMNIETNQLMDRDRTNSSFEMRVETARLSRVLRLGKSVNIALAYETRGEIEQASVSDKDKERTLRISTEKQTKKKKNGVKGVNQRIQLILLYDLFVRIGSDCMQYHPHNKICS